MPSQAEYRAYLDSIILVPERNRGKKSRRHYEQRTNTFASAFVTNNEAEFGNAAGLLAESVFASLLAEFSPASTHLALTSLPLDREGCDVTVREGAHTIGGFNVTLSGTRETKKTAKQEGIFSLVPIPMRRDKKPRQQVYVPTLLIHPELNMTAFMNELKQGNLVDFTTHTKNLSTRPEVLVSVSEELQKAQAALPQISDYKPFALYIQGVRAAIATRLQNLPSA